MSQLKPGVSYIYERANGIIYAREEGAPPDERFEIGRILPGAQGLPGESLMFGKPVKEVAELVAISDAAKTNPALQDALDRVKMLYLLTKESDTTVMHHPV